jgi:MraZ protein
VEKINEFTHISSYFKYFYRVKKWLTERMKWGIMKAKWGNVDKVGDKYPFLWIIMFIGEYSYSIDEKKRLAIPAKFRQLLGKKAVITRGLDQCLFLYPAKEWGSLAKKLAQLPLAQADARGFARLMLTGAMEVNLDNLGRILIPDYLKTYALLKKKVVIAGVYNRVEIWDERKWQEYKKKTETAVGDIAERLKELGV